MNNPLRSLFLHLDESAGCAGRIELAISLALQHDAHLLALATCGWPPHSAELGLDLLGFGPLLPPSDDLLVAAKRACERFAERAQARGLSSFSAQVEEVALAGSLVETARGHDMAIIGQPARGRRGETAAPAALPLRLLMESGRPVLMVPSAGHPVAAPPRTVLLAWKGTREAARAAADALPLLARAQAVHLIALERPGATDPAASSRLEGVQHWLATHGVHAQGHRQVCEGDFGHALLSRAAELGAELIVMGGYGHSRATEFVLGGMTRTVLAEMAVPVLLSN